MDYKVVVLFCMVGIFSVLWLFIAFKGRNRRLSQTYNLFVLNMILWAFGLAMFYSTNEPQAALFWTKVVYLSGGLIPSAFLLFSFIFPHEEFKIAKYERLLIFVPNLVLVYLYFFTPVMVTGVAFFNGTKGFVYGPGRLIWDFHFNIVFIWAFIRFFKMYRQHTGVIRNRLRYIILGTLTGVILAGTTNVMLPLLHRFECIWLGPPLTLTWLVCIAYAILKYQLMDIRIIIKKSLVYSILITMTTAFYILSVITFERFFQNILGYQDILGSFFITLVIAALFTPLKNNIQNLVDKTVFKRSAQDIAKENEKLRREVLHSERYKTIASLTNDIVNEIKTPLTVLQVYGKLSFLKFKDKESLSRFARRYMREVNRINDLLESLMEYSNPEPLATQNIGVLNLISETIGQLKGDLTTQKIQIKQDLKAQDVRLRLDPSQFRQALANIIMNAIEAMPEGGRLWVGTEQSADALKIIVRDSGRGIAADALPRIFDPFFSQKEDHTGLGLSITQGIIEQHGGKIKVRSEVNLGTEFVIELPIEVLVIMGVNFLRCQNAGVPDLVGLTY